MSEGFRTGVGNDLANSMQVLWGGELDGMGGNDTLVGSGVRADILNGGLGNDTLTGGGHQASIGDWFVFDAPAGVARDAYSTSGIAMPGSAKRAARTATSSRW